MSTKLINLYFKHDYGARNDPKLIRIKRNFGYEGLGIYWCFVEIIYENKGELTLEELEDACFDLNYDLEKGKSICQIAFNIDENGIITSNRITQDLLKQQDISKKRSEAGSKSKDQKTQEPKKKKWSPRVVELPEWMDEKGNVKEYKSKPKNEEKPISDKEFEKLKKSVF